jgi:hypothetical protein
MFTSSAIILTINLGTDRTGYLTHVVLSPAHLQKGLKLHPRQRRAEIFLVLWWHCYRVKKREKEKGGGRWHTTMRCSVLPFS